MCGSACTIEQASHLRRQLILPTHARGVPYPNGADYPAKTEPATVVVGRFTGSESPPDMGGAGKGVPK